MLSKWAYLLIGNNDTGKTSLQRNVVEILCNERYERLRCNIVKPVVHPRAARPFKTLSVANRSYQEKRDEYGSVGNYFSRHFEDADVCLLSSHSDAASQVHIKQMRRELRARAYNICAVFWSNADQKDTRTISQLAWQERLWIDNPPLEDMDEITDQLKRLSQEFADMLIARSYYR